MAVLPALLLGGGGESCLWARTTAWQVHGGRAGASLRLERRCPPESALFHPLAHALHSGEDGPRAPASCNLPPRQRCCIGSRGDFGPGAPGCDCTGPPPQQRRPQRCQIFSGGIGRTTGAAPSHQLSQGCRQGGLQPKMGPGSSHGARRWCALCQWQDDGSLWRLPPVLLCPGGWIPGVGGGILTRISSHCTAGLGGTAAQPSTAPL
jgi:hypothetical protein